MTIPAKPQVRPIDRVVDPRGGTHNRDEGSVKAAGLWADHMQRLHSLEVAQRFGGLASEEVPYGEYDYNDDCFYDDHHDFACDWS